jgi:WD40 repeat protein
MARIFISHSSLDSEPAVRMKDWLGSQGFESVFLDKDKATGIPPGADWERTLYRAVEQSQAVIIIQTPNWLASKWCFAEFTQARALGKAIFPAIETPTGDTLISPDIQTLNLINDREGGLEQLKRELVRIALDAQGGFEWNASRPPFPGMFAFEEDYAAVYFGRDDDIRHLIERLDARRAQGGAKLIVLLGSSGSGKSSLLRAGVIPRLKRAGRNWIVVPPMRPQIHPVDQLTDALATARNPPLDSADWAKLRDDLLGHDSPRALYEFARCLRMGARTAEAQILIPIDQAEELFSVADPHERRRFLEFLSQALSENMPFMAVMALRSDFLGQLQSAASLTARFEEFSLGPMPLARIPQIIKGPARVAGIEVEEAFVQQAVRDAETEDALPLLAFALRQLFDRSQKSRNKILSMDGYRALGDEAAGLSPLENAVREAANRVLAEARPTDEELLALREAFVLAMVRVNDKGEYVRRPAWLDALPAKAHPLLERLANARLLTKRQDSGATVVEAAHEALLRKWPWLKERLDAERVFLIGKQQLEQDLRDWEAASEPDKAGALLTGLKLSRAHSWLVEQPTRFIVQEHAFIQASAEHAESENRRKERARQIITWGSLAAAVVLALFLAGAVWEWLTARAAQELATANESRALAALSQGASLQGHYADAAKLALASWPRSAADARPQLSQTIDALGQALSGPLEVSPPLKHDGRVLSAAFSPDGARLVTVSDESEVSDVRTARVWNTATGGPIGAPMRKNVYDMSATFSPDGARVVTASDDNTARLWDAATGAPIAKPLQHNEGVTGTAFSPDGAWVVTASSDKTARVWDAATGVPIGKPLQHEDEVIGAAFSSDGTRVVTTSGNTARLWDAATGAPIGKPLQHDERVSSAAFSPDGAWAVTASEDKTARLWDAATGAPIGKPLQHDERVSSAAFSPDGAWVVTASEDKTARVWDAATGTPIGEPLRHDGAVRRAGFSPNGALVVTASDDKAAQVWDAATGTPVGDPMRHDDGVSGAEFSPDGALVATLSGKIVRLWSTGTGAPIGAPLRNDEPISSAAISPDGGRVLTESDDTVRLWDSATGALIGKPLRLWDSATGALNGKPLRHKGKDISAAFSRDGARVVTASQNTAQLLDAATAAPIGQRSQYKDLIFTVAFNADGARVATASEKVAQLWDAATGAPIGSPMMHSHQVRSIAFSPDGTRVATVASTISVWDAATGKPLGKLLGDERPIYGAVFSPDGTRILIKFAGAALVWHMATGTQIGKPMKHESPETTVITAAFSPDGARVVTASDDNTARLWDAATGALIGKPMTHADSVTSAVFSPDGVRVVTVSGNLVQVWDATTGAPIGKSIRHEGEVRSAVFSPDGARVITASGNAARVWIGPPVAPSIIATACKMLGDHNTVDIAARYGIKIKEPICMPDAPAPDPSRMADR